MLKVNDLYGRKVFVKKKAKKKKDGASEVKLSKLGKVHMAVFSPNGRNVVGFVVVRPDIAGMVKREDAFLAWDSYEVLDDGGLLVTRDDGLDDAARKRLQLDWDRCVLWEGMDAQTVSGKKLGYVSDAEFDPKTGLVRCFNVGDGGAARALVGVFQIPAAMVRGYSKGYMIVDDAAADLELSGGAAAKAGEQYAKVKIKGAEVGKKAGAAAGEAVDKGSYALGRALGKAKRAIKEATEEEAEQAPQAPAIEVADVHVSEPVSSLRPGDEERAAAPAPKTYAPAEAPAAAAGAARASSPAARTSAGSAAARPAQSSAQKPVAKPASKKKPTGQAAAKAVGKQLGSLGKAFSSFKDEFDKASK